MTSSHYVSESPEAPAKRRKLTNQAFDSGDDSADELSNGYETIATVPIFAADASHDALPSRPQNLTQLTQVSADVESRSALPEVQVVASSPLVPVATKPSNRAPLAVSIAPAGTSFKPPRLIPRSPRSEIAIKPVIEVSDDDLDDGPRYMGDSSDEGEQSNQADIKSTLFKSRSDRNGLPTKQSQFHGIIASSKYEPCDSVSSSLKDIPLEAIGDIQMRQKIRRILQILPDKTVLDCRDALLRKKNDFQDAMDLLSQQESQRTNVTIQPKLPAKQQLKEPVKRIHEKWANVRADLKTSQAAASPQPSSQDKIPSSSTLTSRRRLVRKDGHIRKARTPEEPETTVIALDTSDTDSDHVTAASEDDTSETRVLAFFRTCSVPDLVQTGSISPETASYVIAQRPFASLEKIKKIKKESNGERRKKQNFQRIGERLVDKVSEMLAAYNVVDGLIKKCEDIAEPLAEEMASWGLHQTSDSTGELEGINIQPLDKDSGIGTPSSREASVDKDITTKNPSRKVNSRNSFGQPKTLAPGISLKDYQVFGLNWLSLLFQKNLQGGILADEMGLGKTCQVIAFLAHLREQGVKGPHVIIVPSSTLENWLREFMNFCPTLHVVPYYASQNERRSIQEDILEERETINVVLTTYTIAKMKEDNKFIRKLRPVCCIFDEGHTLRNCKAAGYHAYTRIPATFRLLLTGTPTNNNIAELCSLLGFILPSVFTQEVLEEVAVLFNHKAKTDDSGSSHKALLCNERVDRARSMMTPFVLRRKKYQVLKHLPAKTKRTVYCDLSASQRQLYDIERKKAHEIWVKKSTKAPARNASTSIMMNFRKAAIHACLFRLTYTDRIIGRIAKACLRVPEFSESNVDLVYEDLSVMSDMELHNFCERYAPIQPYSLKNQEWMGSGKVDVLAQLLTEYKANGDRVLLFSQFVQVLDILEHVMATLEVSFFRLDGSTDVAERQSMIDEFYQDTSITAFMLSTRAGGAGINLACANKVIIFDSSFNPQDDIQAENRAHRVGQVREVEVIRLVTRNTIEEGIMRLGETKMALDDRIAGEPDDLASNQLEKKGMKIVEQMLQEETVGSLADAPEETL